MKLEINAQKRELGKKSERKDMRKAGLIPGILYSSGKEAVPVSISEQDFTINFRKSFGHVAFWDMKIGNETFTAIVKDKQVHPVSRKVVHIDFMELQAGKSIVLDIPINFNGTPVGTKTGGAIDYLIRSLTVHTLPKDVMDSIEVDISGLDIGDHISVADLDIGDMETRVPQDVAIVHVYMPRVVEETEEEDDETDGEETSEADTSSEE